MEKYKVVSEEGVVLEGSDETVHPMGEVLELDPENQQVKDLLENGTLEVVAEEETVETDEEKAARVQADEEKAVADKAAADEAEATAAAEQEAANAEEAARAEADASEASAAATPPGDASPPAPERHPTA